MNDILRTLKVLKATSDLNVHLVEVSKQLALIQQHTLCRDVIGVGMAPQPSEDPSFYKTGTTYHNVPVMWHEKLEQVPKAFSVILAHEFFDALPIHKFQVRRT